MSENLSIIIKTILASAQESNLDEQIRKLSTQIKERLELKLKIDASDLQVLTKQTEEVANKLKTKTKMKGSQFINLDVEHQAFNEISSRIREVRKNVDELAKVDINTNKKGQMTSATLTYYNKELGQTITETMGWSEAQKKVNGELVKMRTFETQGFKYSDNMAKANAEAEKLVKNNNAVTNSLLAQKNAIEQRDFNYGSLITGVNASTFNSGGNFSSYIKQQYGDSAELIGKFNDKALKTGEIITQANFRVKEGADKWRMYQATLNKTTGEMRMLDNGLKDVVNRQLKFSEAMKIAITRISQWGIATSLVYGSLRQIRSGLETLKELDVLMVDINKVTNLTADSMERMKNASFDTASGYGQKAQSYLSGVAEFSRAGYEEAAGGLSEISLLAQNVGELTSEQANQFLLATDAAYKYKGSQEELTRVIDGVNQIDNKFATSIAKVSEGMTVAGSIASNAGVEVAELSSAIGVMTAITQRSGNEAGRAFRSILMNIRQVKGETEDGEIIDDEALSKSAKALDSVNIKVHEMRNGVEELRNPMDVLKELADKWKTLSTMDQSAITEALGGKYRGNQLVALVENFDMYEKMLAEYAGSAGSAMKENEIRLGSMQSKLNQLSNTTASFWNNAIDSDFLKGVIDGLNGLIKIMNTLVNNSFSSFLIQTVLLTTSLYGLNIAFNALKVGIIGRTYEIIALNIAKQGLIATTRALTATLLASPLFWTVVASAGILAIIKGVNALRNANEELQNSYKKEINLLQEQEQAHNKQSQYYDSQKNATSELIDKREKLINVLSKQMEGSKEAITTQEVLSETEKILGDIAEEVGLQRNASTDSIIKKLGELKLAELDGVVNTQIAERDKLQAVKEGSLARLNIIQQEIASYNNPSQWGFLEAGSKFLKTVNPLNFLNKEPGQLNLENLEKQQGTVTATVKDTQDQIDALNEKINASKNNILGIKTNNIIGSSSGGKGGSGSSTTKTETYISDQYAIALESLNQQLSILDYNKSKLTQDSQEYRTALSLENDLLKQKQDIIHAQADSLRTQIASGTLSQKEIDETNKTIQSLGDNWIDVQKTINQNNFSITTSKIESFDKAISDTKDSLSLAKTQLDNLIPGTSQYKTKLQEVTTATKQHIQALKDKQTATELELLNTNLSAIEQENLKNIIKETTKAIQAQQLALEAQLKSLASEVVQIYKDIYSEQKDIALDAIESQIEAEEDRHKTVSDNLDSELSQYNDIIDAKLKLINETETEEQYQKNLTKAQTERQDIQNQIDVLSLDDSPENKIKIAELNKELAEKDTDIEDLQHDHTLDLRKKNLESLKDAKQDEMDLAKDTEDELYDATKERLDDQKELTEKYWDNIINDEQRWMKLQEQIIKGDLTQMNSDFATFKTWINGHLEEIGTSIGTNLTNRIKTVGTEIDNVTDKLEGLDKTKDDNPPPVIATSFQDTLNASKSKNEKYFSYDGKYYWTNVGGNGSSEGTLFGETKPTSEDITEYYSTPTTPSYYFDDFYTDTANNKLMAHKSYFEKQAPDAYIYDAYHYGDYYSIDDVFASSLGWKVAKEGNRVNVYKKHEGGIVGEESGSPSYITKLVNKMFNVQGNEQIVKALKNELFVPQSNLTKFFIPNMQNLLSSLTPQISVASASSGNQTININIAEVKTEDKNSMNKFFTTINRSLANLGQR